MSRHDSSRCGASVAPWQRTGGRAKEYSSGSGKGFLCELDSARSLLLESDPRLPRWRLPVWDVGLVSGYGMTKPQVATHALKIRVESRRIDAKPI